MILWDGYLPTDQEQGNRVTETHEGCTKHNEDSRYPMSSSATPFIRDKVSKQTTGETTNSEDGSETHEGCTKSNEDSRYPMSSSRIPFIHDKFGKQTAGETTNSEDGSDNDKREGTIRHRNALWRRYFACEDGLYLVEC